MTDRYERIRDALEMGPTPGPWCVYGDDYDAPYVTAGHNGPTICLLYEDFSQFDSFAYGSCLEALRNAKANASFIAACDPDTIRELLEERDQLAAALEAARVDGARLRETLRDVTGVAICALFDSHREDTLREFSLQELSRVTEVTAPLLEEGVTVESVYRRGYAAAIDQARGKAGQEVGNG